MELVFSIEESTDFLGEWYMFEQNDRYLLPSAKVYPRSGLLVRHQRLRRRTNNSCPF